MEGDRTFTSDERFSSGTAFTSDEAPLHSTVLTDDTVVRLSCDDQWPRTP